MNRTNLNILLLFIYFMWFFSKIELYDAYIESNEKVSIVLNSDQTEISYNLDECGTHEYKTIDNDVSFKLE